MTLRLRECGCSYTMGGMGGIVSTVCLGRVDPLSRKCQARWGPSALQRVLWVASKYYDTAAASLLSPAHGFFSPFFSPLLRWGMDYTPKAIEATAATGRALNRRHQSGRSGCKACVAA